MLNHVTLKLPRISPMLHMHQQFHETMYSTRTTDVIRSSHEQTAEDHRDNLMFYVSGKTSNGRVHKTGLPPETRTNLD